MKIIKTGSFTFDDLKPGMIVLRKDYQHCVVSEDKSMLVRKHGYINTAKFNRNTLTFLDDNTFDIIEVFKTNQKFDFSYMKKNNCLKETINFELLKLIWKR